MFVRRHVAGRNVRYIAAADVTCSLYVLSVERECRSEAVRLRQIIEGRRGAEAVSGWAAHFGPRTPGKNIRLSSLNITWIRMSWSISSSRTKKI